MSETKFTPPPWNVVEGCESLYVNANGIPIATVRLRLGEGTAAYPCGLCTQTRLKAHQHNRQRRFDFDLIAAAPDLYFACRSALSNILGGPVDRDKAIEMLSAALAKAEKGR